jgi:hypothetical protein
MAPFLFFKQLQRQSLGVNDVQMHNDNRKNLNFFHFFP